MGTVCAATGAVLNLGVSIYLKVVFSIFLESA